MTNFENPYLFQMMEGEPRTPLLEFVSTDLLHLAQFNRKFTKNSMIYPQHIVLDLDHTLIFSTEALLSERPCDHVIADFYIYIRPHLEEFFEFCFENYRTVNIWSHGDWKWVRDNLIQILPKCYWNRLGFVHHQDHHKVFGNTWIKDMYQIWDDPYYSQRGLAIWNTIIIDDIPENHVLHPLNLLRIFPYLGDREDHALHDVIQQLSQIRYLSDIRDHSTLPVSNPFAIPIIQHFQARDGFSAFSFIRRPPSLWGEDEDDNNSAITSLFVESPPSPAPAPAPWELN